MNTSAAWAAETWDGHAARYGAQEHLERQAIDAALRIADPGPDERVVDLATGTGALLRALAARESHPRAVVGVDRSAGMLARVGPLPRGWHTVCADARSVPLPDGCADLVTCSYLLHLLPADARARVLQEARRLLAPGPAARLVTVTVWADPGRLGGRAAHAVLGAMARLRPGAWGGLMPLDPTSELLAGGWSLSRRVTLPRGGYPSLAICARPSGQRAAVAAGPT